MARNTVECPDCGEGKRNRLRSLGWSDRDTNEIRCTVCEHEFAVDHSGETPEVAEAE